MLESIWTLLANYGLNNEEIADAVNKLIEKLAPLVDIPVIGELLEALSSFAPATEATTAAAL